MTSTPAGSSRSDAVIVFGVLISSFSSASAGPSNLIAKSLRFNRTSKVNTKIKQRYYTSILDKKGKMIFGLANMDNYEAFKNNNASLRAEIHAIKGDTAQDFTQKLETQ